MIRRLALLLLAAGSGCAAYGALTGGYAADVDGLDGGRQSGYLQFEEGLQQDGPMFVGALRLRGGPDIQTLGASFGLAVRAPVGRFTPFVRGAVTIVDFGLVDGDGSFGMFSPHVEGGVAFALWSGLPSEVRDTGPFISVSAGLGYDLRFTGGSAGSWQVGAGFGGMFSVGN